MKSKSAILPLFMGILLCAFTVAGCSGGSHTVTPSVSAVAVTCSPTSISTAQTSTCTATVTGTGALSTSVTWSLSPGNIGSVSSSGVFTPTSVGTATITATSTEDPTKSGSASIAVTLAPPSNLVYPQTTISATTGVAITADTPTVTGTVTTYSVSPALPAGLSLNTSTGSISGTPTTVVAQTTYTVTATNSSGTTTATLQIAVTPPAPSSLAYPQTTISASVGQAITPDIPTVTSTVSSYTITPALPAGLNLDSSAGIISGTPTAASTQTVYTVTATNPGGSTTSSITVTVIQAANTLLELGHATFIRALRIEGGNVLSEDEFGHWALWNYVSGALLADGDAIEGNLDASQYYSANFLDMAGQTFVIAVLNGLEVHSQTNGQLLSVIVSPGLNFGMNINDYLVPNTSWWKLASDGSYICIGSQTGLFVYTPMGQIITSQQGDFSLANVFAAPGQVLVALGPAGQNVIESISTADGTSSVSPAFSGQFNSWFLDGARFLTNESTTVWVYSNTGTQQALVSLPTTSGLTGQGNWIWTETNELDIYPIGSETPALIAGGSPTLIPSGTTYSYANS